jgi:hypothetical protein
MATITSANSVFTLWVPELYPIPQALQQFATDDAWTIDAVDTAEVMMGVDGHMSAGFTPFITRTTIALQADSTSIALFDYWLSQMEVMKEVLMAQGTLLLPGTGLSYVMTNGVLTSSKKFADGKKVLQPVQHTISWESVHPALV